jgi:tRNA-dihydrouridine synthase A
VDKAQFVNDTPHRLCTAPMMDWSDRHCRYFFRQLAPSARVYTEMITTGALIHGDVAHHLDYNPEEHPVALQLGGSEPADLASSAKLGESWGYDEININCGCPSERVQRGAFGACLMAEPVLVADCVRAIKDAVAIPVTVKHRLGIDSIEAYDFVRTFVETLAQAGCDAFIVHARNAILKGLSPKDNRQIPPLKYDYVYRLKSDFPDCNIVINGGISTAQQARGHLERVDGVMLGRAAYHDAYVLAQLDASLSGKQAPTRRHIADEMFRYATSQGESGVPLRAITRHMLGLYHGQPGARTWRRMLSDTALLAQQDPELILRACDVVEARQVAVSA